MMRAIVFGGASGIGEAIADHIYEAYRHTPVIVDAKKSSKYSTYKAEFPLSAEEEFAVNFDQLGKFTHVYITFGLPSHRQFDNTDHFKEQKLIIGNFEAVTSALRVARRWSYPDSSFIITTTVSSLRADQGGAIYASAKAGLNGLVASLAREWVPARVNAIAPGPTATQQFLDNVPLSNQLKERERSPHGTLMDPDAVAQAAVWLSEMRAVSGAILPVDLAGVSSSRRPV